ncbi:transglutaminase domain-containing protein [Streptomyces albus]|uniref:Transglutaminase domain-containing protein n=1 Tax=Streptomyces albus (strain ATCC 21838 / DSM 41398 / FERM P-419 / JCM 4703 / NBRC 107858) TaxID=1081613 RepID=A0A0B5F6Y4_STRA4|nr:transglutaminase domain-containing protein [Streptomyces albus]AOU80468.1 transglutaminase domain-containing protein [Streptomyces albus]AYN36180.1 transglutaminase [Streptomyces albus]
MSGRTRLALCAAAATLLASCALLPLVERSTWILQAAALVLIQTTVGALARRAPLPRPATTAVQALVSLMLLTLFFAGAQAVAGVIPTPAALGELGSLLQAGSDDISRYSIPAPLTEGIRLMLVGGVLVVGLVVDTLAVTYRSAAPAGLPLLALYSVAAGLSEGGAGWLWFLLAAAGYLLLLLAEGRDRLAQWGRVFSGGPRGPGGSPAAAESTAIAPVRTGRRIGMVALGVALVVPLALPGLDGGLVDPARGKGEGPGSGGTISAVNPVVSLQNNLNQDEDREVLTYRTDGAQSQPLYLRIVALDDFDGKSWKPAVRRISDVPSPLPAPVGLAAGVRSTELNTRITASGSYAQGWLPMPYPATNVRIDGDWRFEPVGRTVLGDGGQTTRGKEYLVSSLAVEPTPYQLAQAPAPSPGLAEEFTEVPDSLPPIVARTAREVTRGAADDYEAAVKLQDWFAVNGGFTYDTSVQAGSGTQAIARFLKDKEGFCVHFSFSMAAMARTLGIPARVAVGFTPGSPQSGGAMSVGLRDAHAWPELYFEGVGWTRFEPTPSRGSIPEYAQSQTPGSPPQPDEEPAPSASEEPSAAPSAPESCPPDQRKAGTCSGVPEASTGSGGGSGPSALPEILLLGIGGLLLLGLPLTPMLWRRRTRARRLGPARSSPVLAGAGTLRVWDEVQDSAWDYGIPPDASLTPRRAAERIVRGMHLEGEAAGAVSRVAAAVEQTLYAPSPEPVPGLTEDARRLGAALGASAGRGARLRALLLPRSNARLGHALADHWRGLRFRTSGILPRRPGGRTAGAAAKATGSEGG